MDKERQSDVLSVCTFLPPLAQIPVEQSQDKANEYGLDRRQYGWLEEGGDRGEEEKRDNKKSAANQPKPTWRMEQLRRGAGACCCNTTPAAGPPPCCLQLNKKMQSFLF